jgi:hypothetical protein
MPSREVACEMEVGAAMESAAACLCAFVLRTFDVRPPLVKDPFGFGSATVAVRQSAWHSTLPSGSAGIAERWKLRNVRRWLAAP